MVVRKAAPAPTRRQRVWRAHALLAGAALALLISGCQKLPTDQEQYTKDEHIALKFSHVVAENTPKGQGVRRFAAEVRDLTRGRVDVEVFPDGQLYGDSDELEALLSGKVQMIAPATAKLAELVPAFQVFDLPYAFPDEASVLTAMEGPVGRRLLAGLRRQGMVGLAMWDNGWKEMTSYRRPLLLPADFRGQTFRVQPGSILQSQFELLGGETKVIPFDQTFRALQTHQVDGQENTPSNIYSKKFHAVQRYLTVSNHGYLGYVVIANASFWDHLPLEVQAALTAAMADATRWVRENAARLNETDLEHIRASGQVEVHVQTEAERSAWLQTLQPLYASARDTVGADMVDAVNPLLRSASAPSP